MGLSRRIVLVPLASLGIGSGLPGFGAEFIVVASTTSTEQSGLFGHILPLFEKRNGVQVRVVALGTGQALELARRDDADVVFVHDKIAEEKFVAERYGIERRDVMYNDFVLIGPKDDPAKVAGAGISSKLLRKLRPRKHPSSHAAITAAPTPPSFACGRTQESTSIRPRTAGTGIPVREWALR